MKRLLRDLPMCLLSCTIVHIALEVFAHLFGVTH